MPFEQKKLRIFLAEDHSIVRAGLKLLINHQDDMEVIGEASQGEQACELALQLQPDVVIMDITMPELSGSQATRRIIEQIPDMKVVALTVHENRGYLKELLEAGASGYVLKRAAAEDLIDAIHIVARGGVYVDPFLAGNSDSSNIFDSHYFSNGNEKKLSRRESEVARLIAMGYTNREIASQLKVSIKTVETYKYRVMEKLGLSSRVDFVRYAVQSGWMQDLM